MFEINISEDFIRELVASVERQNEREAMLALKRLEFELKKEENAQARFLVAHPLQ